MRKYLLIICSILCSSLLFAEPGSTKNNSNKNNTVEGPTITIRGKARELGDGSYICRGKKGTCATITTTGWVGEIDALNVLTQGVGSNTEMMFIPEEGEENTSYIYHNAIVRINQGPVYVAKKVRVEVGTNTGSEPIETAIHFD